MAQHIVKVKSTNFITHDVLKIVTEKSLEYIFIPGQATDVSLNLDGWKDEKKPFSFTSLSSPFDKKLKLLAMVVTPATACSNRLVSPTA